MEEENNKIINQFIMAFEDLVMCMQDIDNSCMDAYRDVSKREFALLVTLGRTGTMIMREVATFMRVPMSTATGVIDKLIDKGYVIRTHSPEDRRVILIDLSNEGQMIFHSLREKMHLFSQRILTGFTREEQDTFVDFMVKGAEKIRNVNWF